MAGINVENVMALCIREEIFKRPHSNEGLPAGIPSGPSEMMVEELTGLLEIYKETPNISNYSKIQNMVAKFNETPEYVMELIMREFDLDKPKEEKRTEPVEPIDFLDVYDLDSVEQAKSTLKETKGKSGAKTLMQLGGVVATMSGFYALTSNGSLGHDLAIGAIAVGAGAVGITAVLGGKVAKSVLKLGAKGAKVAFKAAKGTAQNAIEKSNQKREKNKINKSLKQVDEMKKITEKLIEVAKEDVENSLISDEIISSFDKKTAKKFQEMRNGDDFKIDELKDDLTKKSFKEMEAIKKQLYMLKNSKVAKSLLEAGLSQEDIKNIIENTKLTENGELELPEGVEITLDEIDNLGLTSILEKNAQMPKIDELSNEQVIEMAKSIRIKDGKISYDKVEDGKMDSEVQKILDEFSGSEYYIEALEPLQANISKNIQQHEMTSVALKEVQARDRLFICQELDEQTDVIKKEITKINMESIKTNGDLSLKDKYNRERLRNIAEKKVKLLEDMGIVETVAKGSKSEKRVITDAEKILIPDLENVKEVGHKKIERTSEDQEIDYE